MEEMMMKGPHGEDLENPNTVGGGGPIEAMSPTWKSYDNPFYYSCYHHASHHHHHHHHGLDTDLDSPTSPPHNQDHLPSTTRTSQSMDQDEPTWDELRLARARIKELAAELELERRLRKKGESLNKALARQLSEERKSTEAKKCECEELAAEISRCRTDMDKLKKEVEEERKMLRVAEVLREERVQMKLSEARITMEEKLREITSSSPSKPKPLAAARSPSPSANGASRSSTGSVRGWWESSSSNDGRSNSGGSVTGQQQRKEVENPHIKRGIKGFVEFPRVVRSRTSGGHGGSPSGSREGGKGGNLGPKLECQKAQLRVLLKQRVPLGLGSAGTANLVM